MKRFLILLLSLIAVFMFISCKSDDNRVQPTESEFKQTPSSDSGKENKSQSADHYNTINIVIDGQVKYTAKYANSGEMMAFDLLKNICEDQEIEYGHLDGFVNSIAGVNNTGDKCWVYYFNGEMPDVGASDLTIAKGFDNTVDFKYLSYREAFPEE